ncbi:MAG: cyclase family protein [Actinomycetia bacterium]|nr:cyclase family protein [Actinomycetes bacterium]
MRNRSAAAPALATVARRPGRGRRHLGRAGLPSAEAKERDVVSRIAEILKDCPSNWGRFGPDDEIGTLNYLTPEEVRRGIAQVREGRLFPLGLPIGDPRGDLVWPGRVPTQHYMVSDRGLYLTGKRRPIRGSGGVEYADDVVHMYLQGTTQIDSLGHVWYDGRLYNGYDAATTTGGLSKNGIDKVAARGIAGAAVLLDVARFKGKEMLERGEEITLEDLFATAEAQGLELERRDMLLVRTGFYLHYVRGGTAEYVGEALREPGLTYSPELVRWFQAQEVPLYGTDTMGSEQTVSSRTGTFQPLHPAFITRLGLTVAELLWLEDLAAYCAEVGRYRFFLTISPLRVLGGAGSPVNPLAIL